MPLVEMTVVGQTESAATGQTGSETVSAMSGQTGSVALASATAVVTTGDVLDLVTASTDLQATIETGTDVRQSVRPPA